MVLGTAVAAWMFAAVGAPDLTVEWDAPSECPTRDEAREQILRGLSDGVTGRVVVRARVRQIAEDWTLRVEIEGPQGVGHRVLRARTCEEATAVAAVVVAIAVDPAAESLSDPSDEVEEPVAVKSQSTIESATESEVATEPARIEPERIEVAEPEPDPPPPRELAVALEVRGGVAMGSIGPIAGHIGGTAALQGRWWEVYAGARRRTASRIDADGLTAGGRFAVTAAQLGAGPRIDLGALEIPIRAGVELGRIRAEGYGDIEATTAFRLWAAAVLSAGVAWSPREIVALGLGIDGVVPLLRPGFTIGDIEVLTVGRFAFRAWLGVALRFSLTKSGSAGKRQASS